MAFPRFNFQTTPLDPGTSYRASTEKSIASEAGAAEEETNASAVENGPHLEVSDTSIPHSTDSNVASPSPCPLFCPY